MPADRKKSYKAPRPRPNASTSTSTSSHSASAKAGPSILHVPPPLSARDPTGLPGISKIKASIRQTRRLLAKDTLEPGLRVQTQRRLTSLEADLERAQRRELEKKNGEKYHMVKFFERQKLLRLIKRFSRYARSSATTPEAVEQARADLENARIMLNYILHYPNDRKYIALFPTAIASSSKPSDDEAKLSLPDLVPPRNSSSEGGGEGGVDKSEKRRREMLLETRRMMDAGELTREPEVGLAEGLGTGAGKEGAERRVVIGQGQGRGVAREEVGSGKRKEGGGEGEGKKSRGKKVRQETKQEDADEFFE